MSNHPPYWANDKDETRAYRPAPSSPIHPTSVSSSRGVQGASPRASDQDQKLLGGRFDMRRTALNLAVLAGLSAVITFAVVLVVDQILGVMSGAAPQSINDVVVTAILTGVICSAAGLLYIPVVGTGNEELYGGAIISLAVAASVWVIFGVLHDGDWSTISMLSVIFCTAGAAYAAPSRLDAARVI